MIDEAIERRLCRCERLWINGQAFTPRLEISVVNLAGRTLPRSLVPCLDSRDLQ